ncbi:nitrilase [Psychrosphaera sp. F3M07]|uniref:nitrilase-related carbon-nitrogen hydrolase n=1 Tax=Psychrosphaera sp. F3M07 TaxID=2841560 RepID=UPI001C09C768|nr:nitrilase-related carbon-nitrogen hydrolase [Psychrosphaera sp. F3M07]MBU2919573.1 nitrilase [Psychrosphaera sp. F3M07]
MSNAYTAVALQTRCFAINKLNELDARAKIMANIERVGGQIQGTKGFVGPSVKLVVLPEYFMTSFPLGESFPSWQAKACIEKDGKEYEALGKIAQQNGIHLSGNAYELDDNFPDLYFQTSFILNDSGDCIHRYRRLISMFAPTPHDVLNKYLDIYGYEGLFPVTKTELGNLATIASEEILYPEVARSLVMQGAEVFLHSSSEVGAYDLTPKDIAKRARAVENLAYVVSSNSAGIADIDFPAESTDGLSKLVDFKGRVMAEAGMGESMVANAEIDLDALRRYRNKPGMGNILSRQRNELFAPMYQQSVYPANNMLDENNNVKPLERSHFMQTQMATIANLQSKGLIQE